MLKPAILYKKELEDKFKEYIYSENYFYYTGYAHEHTLPYIKLKNNVYQWVMVDSKNNVIGYFAYEVQPETDTVLNFGLFGFDKGNPIIGKDLFKKMEELIKSYRRIEWRVIGGNPVIKHYDIFCKKHNGNKITLHKVCKDMKGQYRDEHIYEIVK